MARREQSEQHDSGQACSSRRRLSKAKMGHGISAAVGRREEVERNRLTSSPEHQRPSHAKKGVSLVQQLRLPRLNTRASGFTTAELECFPEEVVERISLALRAQGRRRANPVDTLQTLGKVACSWFFLIGTS